MSLAARTNGEVDMPLQRSTWRPLYEATGERYSRSPWPSHLPYGRCTISCASSRIGSLEKSGSGAQISSGFTGRWPQNPRTILALSIRKNDGRA
jgi:hypothetical protein